MADTATLPRSGVFTATGIPVPLARVSVDVAITGLCAHVAVTKHFVNREDKPIEAVYVFPLDEGAAVCGFEAIIDGTLVTGEVKEREEAFELYDDAMERGDGAYLLDEERPDVFQASIGNLQAGKEAIVKLAYVTELAVNDGSVRFVVPTTVSPRYAPTEDRRAIGRPDSEVLNPPVADDVPYGLDLKVRLTTGGAIARIESPSHPVSVAFDGDGATIELAQREAALDRDFVVAIDAALLATPCAQLERDDTGNHAVVLALAPMLPACMKPAEVIFLVDRSGSMKGSSIAEVRQALQLCLRSMTEGCFFNIIGFGSSTTQLFPESRAYDDASLREASEHVAAMDADLGGTAILPALELALEGRRRPGLPCNVVVLTDGQVTNTDAALALAQKQAASARIFTFGIGAGPSHHLVNGLARAGAGAAEFIAPGERIEPKVVRLFGRLLSPALTNVRVDWGGLDVTQAPVEIPPVFRGGRLLVYGLLEQPPADNAIRTLRLSADGASGPVSFDVPLDPSRAVSGRTIATLAARRRIRELEESLDWTTGRGSRQRHRTRTKVTREIVELAMRYGLMSRETSYVAIERRENPVTGEVRLRRVPIALTTGWGGVASYWRLSVAARMFREWPRMTCGSGSSSFADTLAFVDDVAPPRPSANGFVLVSRSKIAAASRLLPLIVLQRADGAWTLDEAFATAIGRELDRLERATAGSSGDPAEIRSAWATALALAWLEANASDLRDEWQMLADKANAWLGRTRATTRDGVTWCQAAELFLANAAAAAHPA